MLGDSSRINVAYYYRLRPDLMLDGFFDWSEDGKVVAEPQLNWRIKDTRIWWLLEYREDQFAASRGMAMGIAIR